MRSLESVIGYDFSDSRLLTEALTHPSVTYESQGSNLDNQRLEFLGDAVVQMVFTEALFRNFPEDAEGKLTQLRARLVSRGALAAYARRIDLGSHLLMGRGEEASGGRSRETTLSDAFEALIGAIYLDGGLEPARLCIWRFARSDFEKVSEEPEKANPKGTLQELLQAISPQAPVYRITAESGPDHRKRFEALVEWENLSLGSGVGPSKKEAEMAAARAALSRRRWESTATSSS